MANSKFGKLISSCKRVLDKTINWIVICALAILIVVVFIQVVSRYVFNSPLTWSGELARYMAIWIIYLSSVIVFRESEHLSVDFIVQMFPPKLKKATEIFKYFVILLFILLMLYVSREILPIVAIQTSPTLRLPMSVIYSAFPVAMFLMLIEIISKVLIRIQAIKGGNKR